MTELFGYSSEELVGQSVTMLMPSDTALKHAGYMKRYLETGEKRVIGKQREVTGMTKDGKELVLELRINELTEPSGSRLFVAVLNDITAHAVSRS